QGPRPPRARFVPVEKLHGRRRRATRMPVDRRPAPPGVRDRPAGTRGVRGRGDRPREREGRPGPLQIAPAAPQLLPLRRDNSRGEVRAAAAVLGVAAFLPPGWAPPAEATRTFTVSHGEVTMRASRLEPRRRGAVVLLPSLLALLGAGLLLLAPPPVQ